MDSLHVDRDETSAEHRIKMVKLAADGTLAILLVAVYVRLLMGETMSLALHRRAQMIRRALFGNPPPSEEEITEMTRQVVIEAMKAVRYGL